MKVTNKIKEIYYSIQNARVDMPEPIKEDNNEND